MQSVVSTSAVEGTGLAVCVGWSPVVARLLNHFCPRPPVPPTPGIEGRTLCSGCCTTLGTGQQGRAEDGPSRDPSQLLAELWVRSTSGTVGRCLFIWVGLAREAGALRVSVQLGRGGETDGRGD